MSGSKKLRKEWTLRAEYYNNIIYPLQNKVLGLYKGSPFYLTGGTVLSRVYYNHRYSDDLDLFLNYHPDFKRLVQTQIKKMKKTFKNLIDVDYQGESSCRIFVGQEKLKIEMVNDVPTHIGELVNHPVLGLIDSKENILANKITAIIDRAMPKDFVDVFFLLKDGINIKKALTDAESKAAGISPLYLAKILAEYDYSLIESEIKWIIQINSNEVKKYMNNIAMAIVHGTL